MEDKLKTEIEQKVCVHCRKLMIKVFATQEIITDNLYLLQETEAQLALSKVEELAKAEMISEIAKEKAAQIEKMAEADLNVSKEKWCSTLHRLF